MVNLTQASEIIGCTRALSLAYVKAGALVAKFRHAANGQTTYILEKDYVIKWRYERMRSSEVKELLVIGRTIFEKMVYKGVLTPIDEMGRRPL